MAKLPYEFYHRHALEVAPELVGKVLVCNGKRLRISETEAYCGTGDTACHAHKGRTKRTEVLYADAGTIYVYLCYGMHWLMTANMLLYSSLQLFVSLSVKNLVCQWVQSPQANWLQL